MTTKPRNWYLSRYVCMFLLGVVCALVGSAKAYEPETATAIREQTAALRELTSVIRTMRPCPK